MKTFSIATLLFGTTVIALILAQAVTMSQLFKSKSQLETLRTRYGVIEPTDPTKGYIRRFVNDEYQFGAGYGSECYRVIPPKGKRYALHVSDFSDLKYAYPASEDLQPTETVLLDPLKHGEVISTDLIRQKGGIRVVVGSRNKTLLEHTTKLQVPYSGHETYWMDTNPNQQWTVLESDQKTRLFGWKPDSEERAIIVWLEPEAHWRQRDNQTEKRSSRGPKTEESAPRSADK